MNSLSINGCYSQAPVWASVVQKTYGHLSYKVPANGDGGGGRIDLIHMRHPLFGNSLVSMPFADVGGFRAETIQLEQDLLLEAMALASRLKSHSIELRVSRPLAWLTRDFFKASGIWHYDGVQVNVLSHKIKMVLELPATADALMSGFKSKLRSQIKRPIKAGLTFKVGRHELIDDFYRVFAVNMRDLGSPVHAKKLFLNVLDFYPGQSYVFTVYSEKTPVAGAIVVGCGECLSNPWASSLRECRALSPNMLLYWAMLQFAIEHDYRTFDFGRSTPGEGTHAFKEQWGAKAEPLYWYQVSKNIKLPASVNAGRDRFEPIVKLWQRLPVGLANLIGPTIRKNISL